MGKNPEGVVMEYRLINQEVARLRHAELLRNATRQHLLDEDPAETPAVVEGLRARVLRAVRTPLHAPALRSSAR
jgi:hypothetical protein